MDWIEALVGVMVGSVVAAVVTWALLKGRAELAAERARAILGSEVAQLGERLVGLQQQVQASEERAAAIAAERDAQRAEREVQAGQLAELRTRLDAERQQAGEKLGLLQEAETKLKEQFQLLAGEILERSAGRLRDSHQERLEQLLTPLKERIGRFEQQVRETYDKETRDRTALRSELQKLVELGLKMSTDATNLTQALKGDSKTRGDWGELVLETLLERSGLERDREYSVQNSFTTEDGRRLRPDVVIHLPEDRALVIDSKVSLIAWSNYCEAPDGSLRDIAAKALAVAMRSHVKDLCGKGYQDLPGVESPDFVLMFVPIEPAFALACQCDPQLFQDAFDQHIVIVSPTTLLATLRTVGNIWRYERQTTHALEIARVAGTMYDKFANFVGDLEQIGERIRQTQQAHDAAINKLKTGRGNLIGTAERVRRLGAKAAKKLGIDWTDDASDSDADADVEDDLLEDEAAAGGV